MDTKLNQLIIQLLLQFCNYCRKKLTDLGSESSSRKRVLRRYTKYRVNFVKFVLIYFLIQQGPSSILTKLTETSSTMSWDKSIWLHTWIINIPKCCWPNRNSSPPVDDRLPFPSAHVLSNFPNFSRLPELRQLCFAWKMKHVKVLWVTLLERPPNFRKRSATRKENSM